MRPAVRTVLEHFGRKSATRSRFSRVGPDRSSTDTGASTGTPILTALGGSSTSDGDILVMYTYYGDANLSGNIDGSDYSLIDNGFINHLTGWYNGDFNYDGVVIFPTKQC